jgi:hypothetical protein
MRETQQVAESFGQLWQPPQYPILSLEYWWGWFGWAQVNLIPLLLVIVILLLILELILRKKQKKLDQEWRRGNMDTLWGRLRRPPMTDKQRKAYLDTFREDGIVEFIEAGVYEGKISREEAREMYVNFVDYCGLKGLAPRTDQARLKQELMAKHSVPKAQTEIGGAFLKALKKTTA